MPLLERDTNAPAADIVGLDSNDPDAQSLQMRGARRLLVSGPAIVLILAIEASLIVSPRYLACPCCCPASPRRNSDDA